MEMENKFKKISSSVVPCEADFVEAIRRAYQIPNCKAIPGRASIVRDLTEERELYETKIMSASQRVLDKLLVLDEFREYEFPVMSEGKLLLYAIQCHNLENYDRALGDVSHAEEEIERISSDYVRLLKKDDCDSRDKFRSLTVTALASIFTLAKRCIPVLAYLNEVRDYMANLEDSAATTFKNDFLEDYPFPQRVFAHKIADYVDPETLLWLEDLDRQYELWLQGGEQ